MGGYFQGDSQVLVGPMTKQCGSIFFADKFFVGTDGFAPGLGFTGRDHMRAQAVIDMSERARDVIILTDSDKFKRQGVLGLMPMEKVASVFTDDDIPKNAEKQLLDKGIMVHKVPREEE